MINVNDLVPEAGYEYRYEILNSDGTSKSPAEYMYLKYAPGTPSLTPTAQNRYLFMAMQGFIGTTTVINADGSITATNADGDTLVTVKNVDGSVVYTFTSGTQVITKTVTKTDTGYTEVIA